MSATASSARRPANDCLVEGEYPFTRAEFTALARLLEKESGIQLVEAKAALVYSRLAKRLRALGLEDFASYCKLVSHDTGERAVMVTALTTNVTRFFREPHHFDYLRDQVVAPRAAAIRAGGRLRVWSSACSSGEEPYSIAMTILSVLPDAPKLDVRVLATDIDAEVVETARAGRYPQNAVEPIPAAQRDRYVLPAEHGRCAIAPEVQNLVSFRTLNLMDEWPMKGPFDAIFCRNVAIYFSEETQARLWRRFRPMLTDHGRLYVGHSERIGEPGYASDGLTTYKAVNP
jgi:chemotaxis protein methyltransferase CheR